MKKDRNCGLCGNQSCEEFRNSIKKGLKKENDCPFYMQDRNTTIIKDNTDTHGNKYDFILKAIGDEISARKIVRPFRPDLIEKLDIKKDDIVVGRPMGAGCPVTHVLKVYEVDNLAGLLYTWVVGPAYSRGKEVKDISAYAMIGFEGIAENIVSHPKVGLAAGFMPNFCMLRLTHYGLVNKVLNTSEGIVVRIEDIHIANYKEKE